VRSLKVALAFFRRTPVRTFVLYPMLALVWELVLHRGNLTLAPLLTSIGLVLMLIGYLLYRLSTAYRVKHSGGGPGEVWRVPPERLITSGPYGYTRNPVYAGHLLFLVGLTVALKSELAAIILIVTAVLLHLRVLRDEQRLTELFGQPYVEYKDTVKRWIPGFF
jgi:protein-S-isoprenylcysteine O-methyltransferase Ste14